MNLLLLREAELDDAGEARLDDRRARHLREVLGATPGRLVRCGMLDGPLGEAEVLSDDGRTLRLRCRFEATAPEPGRDLLLLAVPRPKVLLRCLADATALGFGHIVLTRTWRVDKSHLDSKAVEPDTIRRQLFLGLEQGRRTRLPEVGIEPLFKPFVEDRLPGLLGDRDGYVAHPEGGIDSSELDALAARPICLAIGPERGFTDYEVDKLTEAGCRRIRAGEHPLRVETAIPLLYGQLDLLRSRSG